MLRVLWAGTELIGAVSGFHLCHDVRWESPHDSPANRGRLKIVLALSRDVPIVVMDEPLSGLDPLVRDSIMKSLGHLSLLLYKKIRYL